MQFEIIQILNILLLTKYRFLSKWSTLLSVQLEGRAMRLTQDTLRLA